MNIFSDAIRYVAGSDGTKGAVIPCLVDRVATSALPRDRRDALVELATIAATDPSSQSNVGEQALKVTYASLEQDQDFDDTLRAVLELLVNVCSVLDAPTPDALLSEESANKVRKSFVRASAEAAGTNVDAFLGMPNAMVMILDLLYTQDLFIRCRAIELLTAMTANSRETVQGAVLEAPEAVARLTDLLMDQNAIVVTNATLLLSALCESSPEICKIVAFSGVLETVFRTLTTTTSVASGVQDGLGGVPGELNASKEPHLGPTSIPVGSIGVSDENLDPEDAIQVQDSLRLVRSLLSGSPVTQSFMRDSGCIPRLARVLSGITAVVMHFDETGGVPGGTSIAEQYRESLRLTLDCVRLLVESDASDGDRNRSLCASSGILSNVMQICFPGGGDSGSRTQSQGPSTSPEVGIDRAFHVSSMRITGLSSAAALLRGCEEVRTAFSSPMTGVGGPGASRVPQALAMESCFSEISPGVRAAAFELLQSSLLADVQLNLPVSALLNALVGDGGRGQASVSSSALASTMSSSALASIATGLKASVVGWPNDADGAGVFYACVAIGWVASRVRGAREKLLSAYVSDSGDSLLPRSVRALGQAVREDAPAAVRVGLLRLICTWLLCSQSAVSAFLSSAMHLPLVLELVMKKTSTRSGAASAVHIQGLAALVLAICLESAEGDSQPSDGDFVSGAGGASAVIPRGAIVDIIRNRIGVSTFTHLLDELRSSRAFVSARDGLLESSTPSKLVALEKSAVASSRPRRGDLGHEMWYDMEFVHLFDDVYGKVSSRVLSMVSEKPVDSSAPSSALLASQNGMKTGNESRSQQASSSLSSTREGGSSGNSGGAMLSGGRPDGRSAAQMSSLVESSSRDDVLMSYKDLIRTQDISLEESRAQISELKAALEEVHREMDSRNRAGADGAGRDERERLSTSNAVLNEKCAALESMLNEKSDELLAVSNAYTALEAMGGADDIEDALAERDHVHRQEVDRLRAEKSTAVSQFHAECDKVSRLQSVKTRLELAEQKTLSQLESVQAERDVLRGSAPSDALVMSAEWKRRAEVAEQEVSLLSGEMRRLEGDHDELHARLRSSEVSTEDWQSRAAAAQAETERLRIESSQSLAARNRELQMARESASLAEVAAKNEISRLAQELEESRLSTPALNIDETAEDSVEKIRSERDSALSRLDVLSSELVDMKSSLSEWRKRFENTDAQLKSVTAKSEALTSALESERADSAKVRSVSTESESLVSSLKADLLTKENELAVASRRVTDVEEQCADLEEMRERTLKELGHLKEEAASRAEQTIRLSGQVYEADEARVAMESKLEHVLGRLKEFELEGKAAGSSVPVSPRLANEGSERRPEDAEYIAALSEEIINLKGKIVGLQESLDDANDKIGLSSALAHDRDEAIDRLGTLEEELSSAVTHRKAVDARVVELEDKLLLLGEAEEAKKVLSERVGELQDALVLAESSMSPKTSRPSTSDGRMVSGMPVMASTDVESSLRLQVEERGAKLAEVEASLVKAGERDLENQKKLTEVSKNVSESEALLSVVSAERSELRQKLSETEEHAHRLSGEKATLSERIRDLEMSPETSGLKGKKEAEEVTSLRSKVLAQESEGIALQTSINSLQAEVEQRQAQIESLMASVASLEARNITESAEKGDETAALQTLIDQRDFEISALKSAADNLEENVIERDERISGLTASVSSLEADSAWKAQAVKELETKVSPLQESLSVYQKERDMALSELSALKDASAYATVEIDQLKEALSDAARTFKLSAKELAEREELLVEISRDKTTIADNLGRAQEEVQRLQEEAASRLELFDSEKRKLLERIQVLQAREATQSSVSATHYEDDLTSSSVSSAELEATVGLLEAIEGKISALDRKQATLLEEKRCGAERIDILTSELAAVKSELATSTAAAEVSVSESKGALLVREGELQRQLHIAKAELADFKSQSEQEFYGRVQALSEESAEKLSGVQKELEAALSQKDAVCQRVDALTRQLDETSAEVLVLKAAVESLNGEISKAEVIAEEQVSRNATLQAVCVARAESVSKLEAKVNELQASKSDLLNRNTADREAWEVEMGSLRAASAKSQLSLESEVALLSETLKTSREELASLDKTRTDMEQVSSQRILDLETELSAGQDSLDATERQLRELKKSARRADEQAAESLAALVKEKSALTVSLHEKQVELEDTQKKAADDVRMLECSLSTETFEKDGLERSLNDSRADRELLEVACQSTREELTTATSELSSALARCENITTSIEELSCVRDSLSSEVTNLSAKLGQQELSLSALNEALNQKDEALNDQMSAIALEQRNVAALDAKVASMQEENDKLRKTRGRLEEEADNLQSDIDAVEASRAALKKDNADLRAWVIDLEEQASGLQGVAEKFDDMNRILDDAVAAHQTAVEAKEALAAQVAALTKELDLSQSKAKTSLSDKGAAESAQVLARKQVSELDARLKDIRASHALKLASTEDQIKNHVQRCAELETALATAERQLAESASLTDQMFGVESELAKASAEAKASLARAETAESEAEEARHKVRELVKELETSRTSASHEAFSELEAEHNELLLCLAEMELEYTQLKDSTLAGGATSRTFESVSAR